MFSNTKAISRTASARITRWSLTLSSYNYIINHKPGKTISNADALSQLPQPITTVSDRLLGDLVQLVNHLSTTTITANHIRRWTDTDPTLSKVCQYLLQGWPNGDLGKDFKPFTSKRDELSIHNGCVLCGAGVVVPPPGRKTALDELHETHLGASKMKSLARRYIWWPKMNEEIKEVAKKCSVVKSLDPPHRKHHCTLGNGHHNPGADCI